MNYFATAPLIAAIANFLLAFFVLYQAPGQTLNRVFFFFGLAVSIWTFGAFMMFRVEDAESALLWTRILHVGVILLPLTFFHLAMLISESRLTRHAHLLYWLGLPFLLADFTPYFIRDVKYVGYGYFGVAGPIYPVFSLIIPSLTLPALATLVSKHWKANTAQRQRFMFLIVSAIMLFVCGLHDVMPMLGIYYYPTTSVPIYPVGTVAAIIFGALVAYSVLQYQLLDIRLSLGRVAATFTRLIFFLFIGFSLVLILALVSPDQFTPFAFVGTLLVLVVSGLFSSLFFPKLLGGHTEFFERKILGDRFEYQDQVRTFIGSLRDYREVAPLLDDLQTLFVETIGISRFHVVLFSSATQEISASRTWPVSIEKQIPPIKGDHALADFFRRTDRSSINIEEEENAGTLTHAPDASPLSTALRNLKPVFCFPLRSPDEIYGFFILGEKSVGVYTALDLEVLENLASHTSRVLGEIRLKDQVALTEQLESLAVMSRGLAHDLNNLITPINTYLQIEAAELPADSPKADLHRIATKNMQTIRSYVREAVFFATTLSPNIRPISIERLLASTAALCQTHLEKHAVQLACELPVPFEFHGDDVLLQRMLANFIFNAIDASPAGSTIRLRALLLPRSGQNAQWIRLQVVDQGSGISKENISRVFAPYFSTKDLGDQTRGFGLGLTICQKIAHLHQGTISLQSTLGAGTTLQVDLPMKPEAVQTASPRLP